MFGSLRDLFGAHLVARDGELGKVRDVLFDDLRWLVRFLVVDTGGWFRNRRVLVSPRAIEHVDFETGRIAVDLTRAEIENSPPADRELPASRQHEDQKGSHLARYWLLPVHMATPLGPTRVDRLPMTSSNVATPHSHNPHLRSLDTVIGYALHATDGTLGAVDDLLVDTEEWVVRYLVADTRRWLPSHSVLLELDDLGAIDGAREEIRVDLTRDEVKHATEYHPSGGLPRDEPETLPDFGSPRYWT